MKDKNISLKEKRKQRVRMKLRGKTDKPRLSVFRSHRYIYAQIVDDAKGETLVWVNQKEVSTGKENKKTDVAFAVGKLLADKAKKKKISQVVFDRGSFAYHGRVKAVALGAREGGLKF